MADKNKTENSSLKPVLNLFPCKISAKEVSSIRRKYNLTQKELAAGLGVSKRTVEAWEIGRSNVTGAAGKLLSLLKQGYVDIARESMNKENIK